MLNEKLSIFDNPRWITAGGRLYVLSCRPDNRSRRPPGLAPRRSDARHFIPYMGRFLLVEVLVYASGAFPQFRG